MLLKNINITAGLVNGARGVVKTFRDGLPVVQFRNKKEYLAQHEKWIVKTAGIQYLNCILTIKKKLKVDFFIY